jgi:lysozyme family protein
VPDREFSAHQPWLESQRRSRARRFAANRSRRRRWSARTGAGVLLASLTLVAVGGATPTSKVSTVVAVQRALGVRPADGIAGPKTRRAIRRFQRAHGLTVDGIAGPQTLAALGLSSTRALASSDMRSELAKIAWCESRGDPTAVSPSGRYRGKYQFSRRTWRRLGGVGDPARASEARQDAMAAKLYALQGPSAWPNCA